MFIHSFNYTSRRTHPTDCWGWPRWAHRQKTRWSRSWPPVFSLHHRRWDRGQHQHQFDKRWKGFETEVVRTRTTGLRLVHASVRDSASTECRINEVQSRPVWVNPYRIPVYDHTLFAGSVDWGIFREHTIHASVKLGKKSLGNRLLHSGIHCGQRMEGTSAHRLGKFVCHTTLF
jgi:hypothetical protein